MCLCRKAKRLARTPVHCCDGPSQRGFAFLSSHDWDPARWGRAFGSRPFWADTLLESTMRVIRPETRRSPQADIRFALVPGSPQYD